MQVDRLNSDIDLAKISIEITLKKPHSNSFEKMEIRDEVHSLIRLWLKQHGI